MTAAEKVDKARTLVVLDHRFFAVGLLKHEMKPDPSCKTGWINGKVIGYNPVFIDKLSVGQTKTFLAHEIVHYYSGHHLRRGDREPSLYNEACDYSVNGILDKEHFEPIDGWLLDSELSDNNAELNYTILEGRKKPPQPEAPPEPEAEPSPKEDEKEGKEEGEDQQDDEGEGKKDPDENSPDDSKEEGQGEDEEGEGDGEPNEDGKGQETGTQGSEGGDEGQDPDPGGCGEVRDFEGDETEMKEAETQLAVALTQALQCAKSAGQIPEGMERLVKDIVDPELDPRELFRAFMQKTRDEDYSWKVPNRRYIHQGIYLPSIDGEKMRDVVFVIDTSGSIDEKALAIFGAEANHAMQEMGFKAWVIYCDEQINGDVEEYEPGDTMEFKPRGGWGTDFKPPFEWLEREDITPSCLVYFTDLDCYSFPEEPSFPVLWISTRLENAPFGEIVMLKGNI